MAQKLYKYLDVSSYISRMVVCSLGLKGLKCIICWSEIVFQKSFGFGPFQSNWGYLIKGVLIIYKLGIYRALQLPHYNKCLNILIQYGNLNRLCFILSWNLRMVSLSILPLKAS